MKRFFLFLLMALFVAGCTNTSTTGSEERMSRYNEDLHQWEDHFEKDYSE